MYTCNIYIYVYAYINILIYIRGPLQPSCSGNVGRGMSSHAAESRINRTCVCVCVCNPTMLLKHLFRFYAFLIGPL